MILRLLQIPSFSGKMNALNEINKIVPSMSYHPHFKTIGDEEQLTTERIAEWIKTNNVLAIVYRDNLHQAQYVEKLDKLVRFCIKEKVLMLEGLDRIWNRQLAWDFSPNQLDHLFGCFQKSWVGASKKQRDELLDFIRCLAEDD
uniref:UBP34/UBP24/USP9X/USP9Y-like ARM repeat region domain-containing protein n=1 Tax=Amphimedon queenslandica TaxID=400682 RepID=A0A1X7TPY9_AMPQE